MLLDDLEYMFSRNGAQITMFNLPKKINQQKSYHTNRLIEEETSYDIDRLEQEANMLYQYLNHEQTKCFSHYSSISST
uniref:Uncharacterized protein n=1 Tax=Arundo donax TaxID=35708 RepID=A0A0A8ZNP7_ARUDO